MLAPFFTLAARSPSRQRAFRSAVLAHLLVVAGAAVALAAQGRLGSPVLLGHVLLVAGIVEGAVLVGWRLTQLPKSQALEFLLVSPLRPRFVFLAEAAVGLTLLAFVTLSALPVLSLLAGVGHLSLFDLFPLIIMPFTWGALTGLGLVAWAYEPKGLRRAGEVVVLLLILIYLVVGVLAGEKLRDWLSVLPQDAQVAFLTAFHAAHVHTPFAAMQMWLQNGSGLDWERLLWLQGGAMLLLVLLVVRASARLQGHFHERHYEPVRDVSGEQRPPVGDRPLSWWAVKRVMEYSGRLNLWLAGGFCLLYAAYLIGADAWPAWMGRRIFQLCDGVGGVASLSAALIVLAAVPASFQYGLWDSNSQDRCRRLELLLLTDLRPGDYWHAAAAAAWRRGRGYFFLAVLLWLAAVVGGRMTPAAAALAVSAGVLLWACYFAIGFRAFARGTQANGLGMLLTVGVPLLTLAVARLNVPLLGECLPPGLVYRAACGEGALVGASLVAALTLLVARRSLAECDARLRQWYDRHHGDKVMT